MKHLSVRGKHTISPQELCRNYKSQIIQYLSFKYDEGSSHTAMPYYGSKFKASQEYIPRQVKVSQGYISRLKRAKTNEIILFLVRVREMLDASDVFCQ
jgi:hypothetical protein